jgi:hypothetical protein
MPPTLFFLVEALKSQCTTGPRPSGFLGSAARILVWAVAWSGLAAAHLCPPRVKPSITAQASSFFI